MLKILEYEICYCKMCKQAFSDEDIKKKPHILKCGNTVCNECMKILTTTEKKECFFDKTHFHFNEDAPLNFSFIDILNDFNDMIQKDKK